VPVRRTAQRERWLVSEDAMPEHTEAIRKRCEVLSLKEKTGLRTPATQLADKSQKLREQLIRLKVQQRKQERKEANQRQSIVGALVLELTERGEWPREPLWAALEKHLTRPVERALFGLAVDPAPSAGGASAPSEAQKS